MEAPKSQNTVARVTRVPVLAWRGLKQLLWPPVCDSCAAEVCEADHHLCRRCWEQLLTCTAGDYCPRCGRDASRYGLVNGACGACGPKEFHFDGIARAGVYGDALQQMILAFKHDRSELADVLGPLADAALQGSGFHEDIDLLVPVPLHWTRRLLRGYNQSYLLARQLRSVQARISTELVRVRRTVPQPQFPTPAAKARNVAGAFVVRSGHGFAGRRLCLIDDIKTSGATLNECTKVLKQAGATKVYALVLAVAGQRTG